MVKDDESKNESCFYTNGCIDMYLENMNNADHLQHDIQFEAFQGGGSSESRESKLKKFGVYNTLGELELSFAAICMEGLGCEEMSGISKEVEHMEIKAYVLFNIVSNHGERKQWVLYMKGEQGSDPQGFFWCTQEGGI